VLSEKEVAVITGASSGIGAASARALAAHGYRCVLGARRMDRLELLAAETGGLALPLDVTELSSVERFVGDLEAAVGRADVLINAAGGAFGLSPVAEADDADLSAMLQTNVLGLLRVTKALLPLLRRSPRGHAHIVNLSSTAGLETYWGGAGYAAAKHGVRAISKTLRIELNGEPIRITDVAPGLVETEFSLVRFGGDREKAAAPYRGLIPLSAEDIADLIRFAVTRPAHVDIDEIVVRPVAQANANKVHRVG